MKILIIVLFITLATIAQAQQLVISVTGAFDFSPNDLTISNAGEDFPSIIESNSTLLLTTDSNDQLNQKINPNQSWRIEVRKEDFNWNDAIKLEIMRTGNGFRKENSNVEGKVYNGTTYQTISQISSYFFDGRGLVSDIPLQLRLSGLSVTNGADDYETNVVLTIYDN